MPLTATVITDLARLADLESDWHALSERLDGELDFFASYSWTYAFLAHYQPTDWLVVAVFDQQSQQLRAVFPLQRFCLSLGAQQFRACKPLGGGYVPYIDFAVHSLDRRELISVLLNDVLRLHLGAEVVFFWPLHEESKLYLTLLEDLGGQACLKTDRYPGNLHHVDGRSQRFHEYALTRPRNTFKDAAYCQRRLAKIGSLSWSTPRDLAALDAGVKQLCEWNRAKFHGQHVYAGFLDWSEYLAHVARHLLPLGRAELTMLSLDDKVICAALCFLHKKRRCFYLIDCDPCFKQFSPGKILISHLIERTFLDGGVFCMGAGNHGYKRDWTSNVGEIKSAIVFLDPQVRTLLEPHLGKSHISSVLGLGGGGKADPASVESREHHA
jgi:CelD/BcsL family acetyltransferase involved in cellulose biosynthesis